MTLKSARIHIRAISRGQKKSVASPAKDSTPQIADFLTIFVSCVLITATRFFLQLNRYADTYIGTYIGEQKESGNHFYRFLGFQVVI